MLSGSGFGLHKANRSNRVEYRVGRPPDRSPGQPPADARIFVKVTHLMAPPCLFSHFFLSFFVFKIPLALFLLHFCVSVHYSASTDEMMN